MPISFGYDDLFIFSVYSECDFFFQSLLGWGVASSVSEKTTRGF
jgi:hypothetical protein